MMIIIAGNISSTYLSSKVVDNIYIYMLVGWWAYTACDKKLAVYGAVRTVVIE
jgi:hypothetical protein